MTANVKNRGGRPLLEDVPRRNEHLLDVATDIFVRLGYNATTLDRIAAEAGVAKRTIYARYADKQALFFAVMRRLAERRVLENLWGEDELPLREGLRRRARQMMERSLTDSELAIARLFMVELAHFPELGKSLWKAVEDEHGESMIEYFRSHQRKRNIRSVNLNLLAELFLFNIYSFSNRVALHQRDKPTEEELTAYIDNMIDVMVSGIAL
ncbi:MAG TPA: TetR/AcrR family transcriptional regulator [Alphaproteobacteria bacterium]|nr:TetR/AcrR family transcriptional regulator [Alphaproteobacteria bacterium]